MKSVIKNKKRLSDGIRYKLLTHQWSLQANSIQRSQNYAFLISFFILHFPYIYAIFHKKLYIMIFFSIFFLNSFVFLFSYEQPAKILSVGNDVCPRRVPTYKITEKKVKIFLFYTFMLPCFWLLVGCGIPCTIKMHLIIILKDFWL